MSEQRKPYQWKDQFLSWTSQHPRLGLPDILFHHEIYGRGLRYFQDRTLPLKISFLVTSDENADDDHEGEDDEDGLPLHCEHGWGQRVSSLVRDRRKQKIPQRWPSFTTATSVGLCKEARWKKTLVYNWTLFWVPVPLIIIRASFAFSSIWLNQETTAMENNSFVSKSFIIAIYFPPNWSLMITGWCEAWKKQETK